MSEKTPDTEMELSGKLLYTSPEGFRFFETDDAVIILDQDGEEWFWFEGKRDHMFGTCDAAEWRYCYHRHKGLYIENDCEWQISIHSQPGVDFDPNYRERKDITITGVKTMWKTWGAETSMVIEPFWLAGAVGRDMHGTRFIHGRFLDPQTLAEFDPQEYKKKPLDFEKDRMREMSFCDHFISPLRDKLLKHALFEGRGSMLP